MVSKEFYDSFVSQKPLRETNIQLVGAGGEVLKTLGKMILIVSVADMTMDFPFYIAEGLKTGVILDNDVMKEMGLSIDLESEIIKTLFGNWCLSTSINQKRKKSYMLNLLKM